MIQRALVVDDEPAIQRSLAREILKVYQVVLAASGEQALAILSRTDGLRVVVSDLDLGPGPDGLQVLRYARDHFPETARILVTGSIGEDRAREAIRTSVAHYVFLKPWEPGALVEAARALLAGGSKEADHGAVVSEVRALGGRFVAASSARQSG
jgi:DNA-binding NtrC family response regulator